MILSVLNTKRGDGMKCSRDRQRRTKWTDREREKERGGEWTGEVRETN